MNHRASRVYDEADRYSDGRKLKWKMAISRALILRIIPPMHSLPARQRAAHAQTSARFRLPPDARPSYDA